MGKVVGLQVWEHEFDSQDPWETQTWWYIHANFTDGKTGWEVKTGGPLELPIHQLSLLDQVLGKWQTLSQENSSRCQSKDTLSCPLTSTRAQTMHLSIISPWCTQLHEHIPPQNDFVGYLPMVCWVSSTNQWDSGRMFLCLWLLDAGQLARLAEKPVGWRKGRSVGAPDLKW